MRVSLAHEHIVIWIHLYEKKGVGKKIKLSREKKWDKTSAIGLIALLEM